MKEVINQRVWEFLKTNGITIRILAYELKVNEKTLANKISGRSTLDLDTILSIIETYPDLSPDWLLFGRGQMLRYHGVTVEQTNVIGDNTANVGAASEEMTLYKERVQHLEELLKEKERLITVLMERK